MEAGIRKLQEDGHFVSCVRVTDINGNELRTYMPCETEAPAATGGTPVGGDSSSSDDRRRLLEADDLLENVRKLQANGANISCITIRGVDGSTRTAWPCDTVAPLAGGSIGVDSSSDSGD